MDDDNIEASPLKAFTTSFGVSSMASSTIGVPSNLNVNVNFVAFGEQDLDCSVYFPLKQDLAASATFFLALSQSLLVSVSLGNHIKNFPMTVNFHAAGQTTFLSKITVQSLNIFQAGNYGGLTDFKGAIYISALGKTTLPAHVTFRQPPINQDLTVTVKFDNAFTIVAEDDQGNIFSGSIDSTGYFVINNLAAGQYTVIPTYSGMIFDPYQIIVQLNSSNQFVYFKSKNINFLQKYTMSNPTCFINTNPGAAGSFSIEGLILAPNTNYEPIVSIITDSDIEASYKQTLNQNSSYEAN